MRRFSIAGLMLVVLVSGVAVAALKNASDAWAGVLMMLTLLMLTLLMLAISLLGVLQRRGGKRAFWQGFAIFGWGYLVLTMAPWFADQVGPRLPTTLLLIYLHAKANPNPSGVQTIQLLGDAVVTRAGGPGAMTLSARQITIDGVSASSGAATGRLSSWLLVGGANPEHFTRIGHCLFTLLAALLGAGIARWFHRTNSVPPA